MTIMDEQQCDELLLKSWKKFICEKLEDDGFLKPPHERNAFSYYLDGNNVKPDFKKHAD